MNLDATQIPLGRAIGGRLRAAAALATICAAVLTASPAAAQHAARYRVVDLGVADGSNPMAMSDAGHVTGLYFAAGGQRRAFLWAGGAHVDIGTLGGIAQSSDVNDSGVAVGYSVDNQNRQRAVRYENGVLTDLGTLHGGVHSAANSINNAGWIVGMSQRRQGNVTLDRAALWRNGSVIDLGTLGGEYSEANAVNDQGQVVGWAWDPARRHRAFRWSEPAGMVDLGTLGGVTAVATDINDHGVVIGTSQLAAGSNDGHAFMWTAGGGMTDLGAPEGENNSSATAINNAGQIVGYVFLAAECIVDPLIWEGGQLIRLNSLIDPASGWRLTSANDINDRGEIAGTALHNSGMYRAVRLVPAVHKAVAVPQIAIAAAD